MKRKGCERNWSLPTQEELFWHLPGWITENHNMNCLQSPMSQQLFESTSNCSLYAPSFLSHNVLHILVYTKYNQELQEHRGTLLWQRLAAT